VAENKLIKDDEINQLELIKAKLVKELSQLQIKRAEALKKKQLKQDIKDLQNEIHKIKQEIEGK